jgi:hypothetical protein
MNKYFASLSIATTVLFSLQATANPFKKLTPYITENATQWVNESASSLNTELQLTYLNLFVFNSPQSIKQFMQCAQTIEANEEMLKSYEALGSSIMNIIRKYVEPIQKKIAAKTDLSDTEEQTIFEKLQVKIQELVAYVNAIYYQALYNHIAQTNPKSLTYMFDAQGVISPEKRTKMLPASL